MPNDPAIMAHAHRDAMTLLIHAQRRGLEVEPELVQSILMFGEAFANRAQTVAQEEKLLIALAKLAKLVKPASIDGIEETNFQAAKGHGLVSYVLNGVTFGKFPKGTVLPPLAFRSAMTYTLLAMTVLAALLLLLLSTTTQLALFQSLKQIEADISQAETALRDGQAAANGLSAQANAARDKPEYGKLAEQLSGQRTANRKLGEQITDQQETWKVTVEVLLSDRASIWYSISYPFRQLFGDVALASTPNAASSEERKRAFTEIRLGLIERLSYFIPALAAYLGALAYALRGIAKEIVEDSFTEESRMQYRLRSTLAPLLGIAAGMMAGSKLVPSQASPLEMVVDSTVGGTITIAALAVQFTIGFVAGYAIEVVFSIVDNIISGFKK